MSGMETHTPDRPLRIALVSTPMLPVPPPTYAGTERVVAALGDVLIERGHEVTLYAPGDSEISGGTLVPTIERSLWSTEYRGDISAHVSISLAKAWADHERYDIIHSHIETMGFLFARHCPTPVVSTLHGRLDQAGAPELLDEFSRHPARVDQRQPAPVQPGVELGRDDPPRAAVRNVPVQRSNPATTSRSSGGSPRRRASKKRSSSPAAPGRKLRMAAKVYDEHEQAHFAEVVEPALEDPDVDLEFLGEVDPKARDPLYAGALATIMLGAWPEPFGLVAIESLATGTPVIARRAGGLTETIEHGVDGFLVDDVIEAELAVQQVAELDRRLIRERALERFSPTRMAEDYEAIYRRVIAERERTPTAA